MVKEITEKRLYNITLYYLTRFDASSGKVRTMLKRRLAKAKTTGLDISSEAPQWIENIIIEMRRLGYLNDTRYAENKIRTLMNQGKSPQFIQHKLKDDGVDSETVQHLLRDTDISELNQAKRFVARKKIGPYRPQELRQSYYQKDLSSLARAGFSYESARSALSFPEED